MERVVQSGLLLDARYRQAMRSGEAPAEDGDPINAVIREHMAGREQGLPGPAKGSAPVIHGEILLPLNGPLPGATGFDVTELSLRKPELEKVKQEPGMEQVKGT